MKYALSTNWCNRRIETGEEIADLAGEMGFDALELGFHTSQQQVAGFKARLDKMPVGSVHAFCPVPISAPCGYPELYLLADPDEEARKMASLQVRRNIEFAAEMGASTVVLHAGHVSFSSWLFHVDTQALNAIFAKGGNDVGNARYAQMCAKALKRRAKAGAARLDVFRRELETLVPALEQHQVTLALENLPYLEGFPNCSELATLLSGDLKGAPVKGWFDTGHDRVQETHGWKSGTEIHDLKAFAEAFYVGMHLNDVVDFYDDHLPPGEGKVDFAALKPFAEAVRHVVFEPNSSVTREALEKGLAHIRGLWA